jgi:prevent-host-death family protein
MEQVGVKELKAKASEILRCVREDRATYIVTVRGEQVARLMPLDETGPVDSAAVEAWIRGMDALSEEIDRLLDEEDPVSAVDLVRGGRRDL